jgi:hypothetical protein
LSDGRSEYERRVLERLRDVLPVGEDWLLGGEPVTHRGGIAVRIESVELEEHSVVVLLRDARRPECLFGFKDSIAWPGIIDKDTPDPSSESNADWRAEVYVANLIETLVGGPGLRQPCSSGDVTWLS